MDRTLASEAGNRGSTPLEGTKRIALCAKRDTQVSRVSFCAAEPVQRRSVAREPAARQNFHDGENFSRSQIFI